MRSYSQVVLHAILLLAATFAVTGCGDDGGTQMTEAGPMMDSGVPDAPPMMEGGPTGDGGMTPTLVEDPVSALVAARTAVHTQVCNCNFEEFEFATVEECVDYSVYLEENNPEGDALTCDDDAAEAAASVHAEYSCRAGVFLAHATCLAEAECDMAAVMACDIAEEAQLDDCDEATETDDEAYVDALVACVSGPTSEACPAATSSETGAEVFSANTFGAGNDFTGSCSGEYAPDVAFEWTAPEAGRFVIETFGSRYDSSLYVLDGGCGGDMELGCNDDIIEETDPLWEYVPGYQGGLILDLTMGQTILVVLDGYDGAAGAGVVAIYPESDLTDDGS